MRSRLLLLFLCFFAAPAAAQSALDGPLAPPDAPAPAPAHHAKAKAKRVHHAAAKPAQPSADIPAPSARAARPAKAAPDDPVSLGMKWNGSNDTAAQTRYENLNGNAPGTGAEVGLKLHF